MSPLPMTRLHSGQSHAITRSWSCQGSDSFQPSQFILPIFVLMGDDQCEDVPSLPGVQRMGINKVISYLGPLIEKGLKSVLLFPVVTDKPQSMDIDDITAVNPVTMKLPQLKSAFPGLLVCVDVCLCAFSPTGHCGVSFDGEQHHLLDNDGSIGLLAELALSYAKAGADVIAPSDMMDGRIGAIRSILNNNRLHHVSIMSYSAKFASTMYGPFRSAAGSAPSFGDRKSYQLPPGSAGLAMRAVARDIDEGADSVMVKPATMYLDIVQRIRHQHPEVPIVVYHVSGECAMLHHAAQAGVFDLKDALMETMVSFQRSGATVIITYFVPLILDIINDTKNNK